MRLFVSIIFLTTFPPLFGQDHSQPEFSDSWVIPFVFSGETRDALRNLDEDGPWVTVEYFASPKGEILHTEIAEKVWWLQDEPILLLGGTGEPLPQRITRRATAWIKINLNGEPLGGLFPLEPRSQGLRVQPQPEALREQLRKRLGVSNAAYLSQVANFLAKNTSVLNIEANAYNLTSLGTVINSSGEWQGETPWPWQGDSADDYAYTQSKISIDRDAEPSLFSSLLANSGLDLYNFNQPNVRATMRYNNSFGEVSLDLGFTEITASSTNVFSRGLRIDQATRFVGIGDFPQARLHVPSATDISLSEPGTFVIGALDNANLGFDNNEIIARNNGSPATLFIQDGGGHVEFRSEKHTYKVGTARNLILEARTANSPYFHPSEGSFGWLGDETFNWFNVYTTNIYRDNEFTLSDRRIKKNITTLDNPVELLGRLQGVRYDIDPSQHPFYKNGSEKPLTYKHRMGFVAQEFAEVFPSMVSRDDTTGLYSIRNQEELLPVLVEAIKTQQTVIDALTQRVKALETAKE